MTQRTDVVVARSAGVGHVLVERQLLVEGDTETSDRRYWCNDGIRHADFSNVFDSFAPSSGRELNDLRLFRIELETVNLQPRVNSSRAVLELFNADGQVGSRHCHVDLRVVGVLVMADPERADDAGQWRNVQRKQQRSESRSLRHARVEWKDAGRILLPSNKR